MLVQAMNVKDRSLRKIPAYVLGEIGGAKAVELLIAELKNEDQNIRGLAAYVLGKIKDPRSTGPLISSLKGKDKIALMRINTALRQITGMNFGLDVKKWNPIQGMEVSENLSKQDVDSIASQLAVCTGLALRG